MQKIEKVLTITDMKTGEFEYEINFQETPQEYRGRAVRRLMDRYPSDKFVWSWGD